MKADEALVRRYVDTSLVMRLATQAANGGACVTPLWFAPMGRGLVASTAAGTVAARHATEDPRVSVLLDGERQGPATVVLRLTGQATVHPGLPPLPVLAHLARRYYLAPAAVRCEVQHLRLWRLRMAYYAQADAVWIEVRPTAAELLSVPG